MRGKRPATVRASISGELFHIVGVYPRGLYRSQAASHSLLAAQEAHDQSCFQVTQATHNWDSAGRRLARATIQKLHVLRQGQGSSCLVAWYAPSVRSGLRH